ncbi:MAG: PKD domain-containing protein, partial [Gemmatimonadota bacterium]
MGSVRISEGAWPCPDFNCTAGDVTATGIWLGDINGNALPNCNPGDSQTAYIWFKIHNGTGTERYAVWLTAGIYIDGSLVTDIDQCIAESIGGGIVDSTYAYSFTWACGSEVKLSNHSSVASENGAVISWSTTSAACTDLPTCTSRKSQSTCAGEFIVEAPLVADFSAVPTSGCAPLTVQFTDETTGGNTSSPYTYSWTFGDGGTSFDQNPLYTYNTAGTYTVTLEVTDESSNTDSETKTNYITVYAVPIASASSNSPVCEDETIELTGGPDAMDSYSWTGPNDFVNSQQSPTIPSSTSNMDGTYQLIVIKSGCPDTATVDVSIVAPPVPTAPDVTLCSGYSQQDLEDAVHTAGGGCDAGNETITDNGNGTYTVTCDNGVCDPTDATGDITVLEVCVATAPDFSICIGTTVDDALFTSNGADCSAGCGMTLSYSFDGNTAGKYSYTVTCDNGVCDPTEATGEVTVVEACVATAPDFSICIDTTVDDTLFTSNGANCSVGCGMTVTYDFDGSTIGTYPYTVDCESDICDPGSATGYVTVEECCIVEAIASSNSRVCEGDTVKLFGEPDEMCDYSWVGPECEWSCCDKRWKSS